MSNGDVYLKAMLGMLARQSFPPKELAVLVGRGKQIEAYNLCDGSRTQSEVAKELKLDSGNFSKTVARWLDLGILLRVSEGKELRPVHLYVLPMERSREIARDG